MESASTARDYMAGDVVVLKPDVEIHHAMRVLLENDISGAPVIEADGSLVGILTEKDCFKVAFETSYHREPAGRVSEYMSRQVETIDADMNIVEVAQRFFRGRYRRFPVLSGNRLVGQISRRDVLQAIAELW